MRASALLKTMGLGTGWALLAAMSTGAQTVDSSLSFFITGSAVGQGANLGGLAGADAHCQKLADSVGAGAKTWRAYLSTQAVGNTPAVNARDRIGTGPWFNVNKVQIAANLTELHDTSNTTTVNSAKGLTHRGTTVASNRHDIMTGSRFNGMAPVAGADSTCSNWTSSTAGLPGRTIVGHHNRQGISSNMIPNSWNQAHVTSGCSQANVEAGGGSGFFYCFAVAGATGLNGQVPGGGPEEEATPYYLSAGRGGLRGEEVVLRFTLDRDTKVEVSAMDIRGRERAVLLRGMRGPGEHVVRWNGTDANGEALPAGMYRILLRRDGR
ncbi:MAG: hypothetical protein K0Q91_1196 [Fibrobacteria bacterium]|jgi:hypothetical protein|nr:hypothetical protein [Fibrobacteria bacterium]